jgi:hypothetical protein
MLRHLWSIGLVFLGGLLCFFALDGRGSRQGLAKLKSCSWPGTDEKVLCGKFTVFENRQTRNGRTINLNVVVMPALD